MESKINWIKLKVLLKRVLVNWLGDKKTEIEGAVEKVVAKAKDGLEDVKEGIEGAVEGLKK